MKKYQILNINIYEVDFHKDKKVIDKLIDKDYIIIYDKSIDDKNDKRLLLAPLTLSAKSYYNIIKLIYPYSYAVYNMLEVGFIQWESGDY